MLRRLRIPLFATLFMLNPVVASTAEPLDDTSSESVISRVLFGSCIRQDRPTPIFSAMLKSEPQLLLFLGDNIYADTSDINVMRAKYNVLAENKEFQSLRSCGSVMATWDDHDYGLNDGGASYPERDAAQQVFLDFWEVPEDSPRRQQPGVYDAQIFGPPGKRVQVIMLDTRYFRSPLKTGPRQVGGPYLPDEDPEKTMLGETQWRWLERQLRLPAELRVIASGIQVVAEAAGQETWANLPHEQQRLFDLVKSTDAGGVVIVSGDRHWAEVSVASDDVAYPLIDATSSSLNQKHPRGTPTRNQFRDIPKTYHEENFGVISIDWNEVDPLVTIDILDMAGAPQIKKSIRLSELQAN
ncbi:alkaline phosphatase D family protein [Novipirellula caenicola]|uniref:PhoD-like phosphatase metallophosphatase domain-containing protein n=1 Tax=Novipirellula caenicola TaxID=1536901 RepID=A0ABP9VID3_9BACT